VTLFKFEGFLTEVSVQGHLTKGQLSLDYLCGGEIYGDSPKQKPPQISDLQERSAEQSYGRLLQRGGFYAEIISDASGHFSNFFVSVDHSSIHLFALAVQSEPAHRHLPHPGKTTTPQRDVAESSSNRKSLRQKITQAENHAGNYEPLPSCLSNHSTLVCIIFSIIFGSVGPCA
jgi:hypothetical protein